MVLRRIFGRKIDEVTGEWRRLHYENLRDLFSSPNINSGDQMKKKHIGVACGKYRYRCIQGFDGET